MLKLAFPSWVKGGNIAANVNFIWEHWQVLQEEKRLPKIINPEPEIGLCFFEAAACLEYYEADLPVELAKLPCSWHIHLPLDLPFCSMVEINEQTVKESFDICQRLLQKCEFLGLEYAVLHPPAPGRTEIMEGLSLFSKLWEQAGYASSMLLIENQPNSNIPTFYEQTRLNRLGICLDLAHLYMNPARGIKLSELCKLASQASLWHINAPGPKYKGHSSLSTLTPQQVLEYQSLFKHLKPKNQQVLMLEIFDWSLIEQSLPLLFELLLNCFSLPQEKQL